MPLKRSISNLGLLFTSISCMIGSGWLFGAFYSAQIAGPGSVLSWLIGGLMIIFLSLVFSELSTMLPVAGGLARYTMFSHGNAVSFCMSFLAWLSCVSVAPTEVQAILQYVSRFFPWLTHQVGHATVLTWPGLSVAACMMFAIVGFNNIAVKLITKTNQWMSAWKMLIPIITVTLLIYQRFDWHNFTQYGGFMPSGIKGVLSALPAAVVFSFLGFREATSLAGEAQNPNQAIPTAVIGSVLICTLIYAFIQVGFIGMLTPEMLKNGWTALHFSNDSGPFAGIATTLGLGWLASVVYADALISPSGTAIIYTTTTSRINYAASKNFLAPRWFGHLNTSGTPYKSVIFNGLVGLCLFFPLPGWQALVKFQSIAIVLAYATGPICLLTFRKNWPLYQRPFAIKAPYLISFMALFSCLCLCYWSGWAIIAGLMASIIVGMIMFVIYQKNHPSNMRGNWDKTQWLIPYFGGISLICYVGNFGGHGWLQAPWDYACIAILTALVILINQRQGILDPASNQPLNHAPNGPEKPTPLTQQSLNQD